MQVIGAGSKVQAELSSPHSWDPPLLTPRARVGASEALSNQVCLASHQTSALIRTPEGESRDILGL